jgi:Fe-S-cluster containining protein
MSGCAGCGKCCRQVVFKVRRDDLGELIKFYQMHDMDVRESEDGKSAVIVIRAKCDWLSLATLRCKFYDKRPSICREYLCSAARRA